MAKKETTPKPARKTGATAPARDTKAKKAPVSPARKPAPKPAAAAKKAAPAKPAAKVAPKTPVKKAPAPKAAPKKAAPKAAPKTAAKVVARPASKAAAPKPAPKQAAPVRPQNTPVTKAAPKSAPPAKVAAGKKPVAQKAPMSAKGEQGVFPQTFETEARKLALQKIQAKRSLGAPEQRPAPNVAAGLEPQQPTGMYNGIVVTHEVKPFPAKTPYSKQELDELREALQAKREELLGELASLQGTSMEALVGAKEGSGYSIHIAEHASDLQTAEANMGVRSIEEDRLKEIESALDRIENNPRHYGLCMACGNKIGIQRLKARPHAHLCMPCRTRYETIRRRRGY